MRNRNYAKELEQILSKPENYGKHLFLHSCCAPCSSYVLEYLSRYFQITVLYYNPNISPRAEYDTRAEELKRLIDEMEFIHPMKLLVGEYEPEHYLLREDEKMSVGPYAISNYCMEAKRAQAQGMINAKQVILDVAKEFETISGRKYGFFEEYMLEDAEFAVVAIGSVCGTIKDAIDELRSQGVKAGLLKVRVFRPFPGEEMAKALKHCKSIAILDRAEGYNANGGPLGAELTAALYKAKASAEVVNIIYGLSGRDVRVSDVKDLFVKLQALAEGENSFEDYPYLGLRSL